MASVPWNRQTLDDLSWFWVQVEKTDECWLWHGCIEVNGYGVASVSGKTLKAHVIAYEALIGPKPEGMELDHLCRIRHCVNPAHLEPVTHQENTLRGTGPTAVNAAKDVCDSGHPFDADNTYWRHNGGRDCRQCRRVRSLAYYYRKKAA